MNYPHHYARLVARARGRALEGYRNRHHVVPRCLGGGDEAKNIVELTAREHFVAHQLLCKIYPNDGRLAIAAFLMAKGCSGSRAYEWLRRKHAEATADSRRGKKRKPFSLEWRQKLAAVLIKANRGRTVSPAERAQRSARAIGRKHSRETRLKMAIARRGRRLSAEHAAKLGAMLRAVNLGTRHSAEHKAKIAASMREAYRTGRRAGAIHMTAAAS